MDLTAEIVDKKVTETACQALGLIRKLAGEEGVNANEYQILSVMVKLLNPDFDIKRVN